MFPKSTTSQDDVFICCVTLRIKADENIKYLHRFQTLDLQCLTAKHFVLVWTSVGHNILVPYKHSCK